MRESNVWTNDRKAREEMSVEKGRHIKPGKDTRNCHVQCLMKPLNAKFVDFMSTLRSKLGDCGVLVQFITLYGCVNVTMLM